MLLQRNSDKDNHKQLLIGLIEQSDYTVLCSGWLKLPGLEDVLPAIDVAMAKGAKVIIYSNRKQTKNDVREALRSRSRLTHLIVDDAKRHLHTKLYYFEAKQAYTAVIGSANITKGGLNDNDELSVVLNGIVGDLLYQQLQQYLKELASMKFVKAPMNFE